MRETQIADLTLEQAVQACKAAGDCVHSSEGFNPDTTDRNTDVHSVKKSGNPANHNRKQAKNQRKTKKKPQGKRSLNGEQGQTWANMS